MPGTFAVRHEITTTFCTSFKSGAWMDERSAHARRHTRFYSVACSHLARRLSGPAFASMRECAHVIKAEQPGDLRYMHLTVIEVTKCQIVPQLLKYFSEVQPIFR